MADPFQILLAGLSGGVRGFSQRKRENELLVLEQKKERQKRQLDSQGRLIGLLTTFYKDRDISIETLKLGLDATAGIVSDNESNDIGQLMDEIEFIPQEDRADKPLTEFQRLTLESRKRDFDLRKQGAESKETERRRIVKLAAETKVETRRNKKIKGKLEQFDKQIKNHRARISQILKELKDFNFKKQPDRKKSLNFEIKNRENKIKSLETQSENLIRRIGRTGRDKFIQSPFGGTLITQENSKVQLKRLEAQVKQDIQNGTISAEDGFFKIMELKRQLGTQ